MLIDQRYVGNVQFEMHAVQLAYSVSAVNPIAGFVLLAYVTVWALWLATMAQQLQ